MKSKAEDEEQKLPEKTFQVYNILASHNFLHPVSSNENEWEEMQRWL